MFWHDLDHFVMGRRPHIAPDKAAARQGIGILVVEKAVEFILEGNERIDILAVNPERVLVLE